MAPAAGRIAAPLLALLLVAAHPGAAGAAVRFFTGTVTAANDAGGHLGISVNDSASGRFVWSQGMGQLLDGPTYSIYQQATSGGFEAIGVTLTVNGVTYSVLPGANVNLHVHDDHTTFDDRFSISDANLTSTGGPTFASSGLAVTLQDEDATAFASTAIPWSLPSLASFESATASLTLTSLDGTSDSASILIDLTSLDPPPAPASSPPLRVVAGVLIALAAGAAVSRARPAAGGRPRGRARDAAAD